MPTNKDYYRILGLISTAESTVIKAAYKALMMIYHPDRNHGNKEDAIRKTKDINEAYAVLSNLENRKKYDAQRLNKPENLSYKYEIEVHELNKKLMGYEKTTNDYKYELNEANEKSNYYIKIATKYQHESKEANKKLLDLIKTMEILKKNSNELNLDLNEHKKIINDYKKKLDPINQKSNNYKTILKELEDIANLL